MRTQIGRWGNSLAARIPVACAKDLHLKAGMELGVFLIAGGILLRPHQRQYSLEDLVSGITPETTHEETNWGEQRESLR
jgi:antitoxin component of MazEF toxin-antitoxin module